MGQEQHSQLSFVSKLSEQLVDFQILKLQRRMGIIRFIGNVVFYIVFPLKLKIGGFEIGPFWVPMGHFFDVWKRG